MKNIFFVLVVAVVVFGNSFCYAKHHSDDIWKGALIGAGATVVGSAILDSRSKEPVQNVTVVQPMQPVNAYQNGYQDGFNNGYKAGYTQGYKDGVQDEAGQHTCGVVKQ
jgi:hypothetical protein